MKPFTLKPESTSIELCGLQSGSGGPKVMALHGWLDNAGSFVPMASHLEGVQLVCLDFPGHGLSAPRPRGARYYFDDYVFDVLAAADALGWERFHLLGHSLGGAVATVTAAVAPQRIASLNLIEGLGPLSASPEQTAHGWRQAVARSRMRERRVHTDRDSAVAARGRDGKLPPQAAAALAERGLVEVTGGVQWRHDLRLTWPSTHRYTEPQVLDLIGAIECSTINVFADPPSRIFLSGLIQRRLAALARPAGPHWIPGGHHVHMERPGEVAEVISAHIRAHAAVQ